MQQISKSPLFPLGQVVPSAGALAALEKAGQQPQDFLARHVHGDWGDLCDEDRNENRLSLEQGFRLLSSYSTCADDKADPNYYARLTVTKAQAELHRHPFVSKESAPSRPPRFEAPDGDRTRA